MKEGTEIGKDVRKIIFRVKDLAISSEDVEVFAQMGDDMPSYQDFINKELSFLDEVASVSGGYTIISPVQLQKASVEIDGMEFQVGEQVSGYYTGMEKAALFVCTAGDEVSKRSKELFDNGDFLEGYLVDVLGSVLVEKAMDQLQAIIHAECLQDGLNITNRYSPGYCNWNVGEQQKLFSFFPDQFCGILLSESSLMSPAKSVSGIIGIGEKVSFQKHVCSACSSRNCLYRNKKKK
ncbi:vitamin B12 dependent-methionine synthase activation domain-containing protein [Labilibaculum antarcticum]|uniref:AdoMet activation domain-containing protein n=1 Tax=Labilibaculum antarcticum TaxID=1717717 RepID=A0A1Y1CLF7_9BACT|nr:vitamin B12 dependent-methionine synthase activation domain-containing protein [Labilibaculum antarcticum]BAX81217.1 hypothetical protein ALGA_2912 [Labilibaculum antarcticum]